MRDAYVVQVARTSGLRLAARPSDCVVAQSMLSRLHEACVQGDLDVVQELHNGGASVNAGTTEGFRSSPLHLACLNGHPDLAQWLHSVGASLDPINDAGETPLHCACWGGHLDVAQWLHSMGASLDTTDMAGQTPLHHACWMGRLDVAQWLCSAGADATLKTNDGDNPAQLLQWRARDHQLDQQALRSTMACLVRRAQGPLLCTTAPIGVQI